MKIKDLLTDKTKWTRRNYAVKEAGHPVHFSDPEAVAFCMYGAIDKCYRTSHDNQRVVDLVRDSLPSEIAQWNDDPKTTFEDVKAIVERLDI